MTSTTYTGASRTGGAVPPSPPARRLATPRWLNARLIVGVLLILTSIGLGARIIASADSSVEVLTVTRDLAAGTVLTEDDLRVERVRLFDNGERYVSAQGPRPTGYVLVRPVGADEFLPREAVSAEDPTSTRLVTVAVRRHHFPAGLQHGQRVDVYVSARSAGNTPAGPARRLLTGVPVHSVTASAARLVAQEDTGVVLRVPAADVQAAVAAAQSGAVDLVTVPADEPAGGEEAPEGSGNPAAGQGAETSPAATP